MGSFSPEDPRRHLLALVLVIICGALLWASERGRTITTDEQLHLVRGYAFWWTHDTRMSYAHPPLANAITSLAHAGDGDEVWGLGRRVDGEPRRPSRVAPETPRSEALTQLKGWDDMNLMAVSSAYFRHDFHAARAELTDARRIMMLWTLALGLVLYRWADRRWGFVAGIVALALYCLHPTLLAHGRLVTTDIPMAFATMLSLAALIRWIEAPSGGRAALFGLAATLMVLVKHSGAPVLVVMSLMVLGAAGLGYGGFAERVDGSTRSRLRALGVVAGQLALIAVAVILAIDAIYLFDRVGLSVEELLAQPEPHNWIADRYRHALLERSVLGILPSGLRIPLPYTWIVGVVTVAQQNAMGHGNYFFGPRASSGNPLYFPVMIFAKSPVTLLALLGAGLALLRARLRAGLGLSVASSVLLAFAAVSLASACASSINIGVRHVLPLLPIMILFAARSAQLLIEGARAWRARALVGVGLAASVAGAAWTFPNWLGDFNVLVGGPAGGHRISLVGEDWGQDLGDVAAFAHAQGWERVVYHGRFPLRSEELQMRGLEVRALRCNRPDESADPVVIHASEWALRRSCYDWLGDREPSFVINHHVFVFVRDE